jgi:peptidyl-Lys metalloendopeptidase
VTLSILSSKTFYAANEPVLVDVILKNNELKKPARILDWLVPCQEDTASPETPTEMSYFSINTADGYVAKYLGAVFKRAEPVGKDYKMLMPGEEVSCTIDLGQYYDFASKSDDNSYVIKYSVKSIELSPKASSGEGALESLESNALTIRIDARNVPTRSLRERKLQSLNSFRSCDTTKQSMLVEARSRAYSASSGVLGVIDSVGRSSSSQSCPRYKEWFGDFNSNRHNELRTGYLISRDQLNSASITFDCGCTR